MDGQQVCAQMALLGDEDKEQRGEFGKVALPLPTAAGLPPPAARSLSSAPSTFVRGKPLQVREGEKVLLNPKPSFVRSSRAPVSQSEVKRPRQLGKLGRGRAQAARHMVPFLPPRPLEPPWSCWGSFLSIIWMLLFVLPELEERRI